MYNNAAKAYGTQEAMGASPVLQVAMLYERAISSLHETVAAIEAGDVNKRWAANKRALDIVTALMASLDAERGGEIARDLDQLYLYLLRRLPMVDVRNDPAPAKEAIDILKPLCESWQILARGQHAAPSGGATGDGTADTQRQETEPQPSSPGQSGSVSVAI